LTTARGRAAFDTISRAEQLQTQVKARPVADAKEHAEEWVAALVADADFRTGGNAGERKRRAGDFVTVRLGFASPDVRDRLLSIAARRSLAGD
jgi:hypothetical protein